MPHDCAPDAAPAASTAATVPILDGMRQVADRYDGFILDLWGVIHDGERPYAGVAECLARLRDAGKRVCLLSNAPRRVASVVARLEELGLPRDLYDAVLSSGEATHDAIRNPPDAFHAALGRRCLNIGPPRDEDVHLETGVTLVHRPEDADFVLCTGVDEFDETLDDYAPLLRACAARHLPMVCANPDLTVVAGDRLAICAGTLAAYYEELGERVAYHGKPHPPIYRRCLALLDGIGRDRILAVGDSLRTDIAGANAAGVDSLLVTGGIHADELNRLEPGNPGGYPRPDPVKVAAAVRAKGHRPRGAIARLVW